MKTTLDLEVELVDFCCMTSSKKGNNLKTDMNYLNALYLVYIEDHPTFNLGNMDFKRAQIRWIAEQMKLYYDCGIKEAKTNKYLGKR